MAVNADVPPLEVHFLEYPDKEINELGARGIGEIGLAGGSSLAEQAMEMGLDRRVGNAQCLGRLRHSAHLHDGEQNAQFARCELIEPGDGFGR